MKLALEAAWQFQGLTYPNPAVGCVVVKKSILISLGAHQKAGDPHAEVMALKKAYFNLTQDKKINTLFSSSDIHNYLIQHHNGIFNDCELYVTLEPCNHTGKTPACSSLVSALKLKKVYISVLDSNVEASGGVSTLKEVGIEVESGLCEDLGKELLEPFTKWQEKNFVTFKWAQRLDGTIDGGIVSDEASRTKVHAMRDVCDLLVIGGNTVRMDRPTLDARLVNGNAPDVLIYSTRKDFDKEITLFKIEGRQVFIEENFDKISKYKNILIEGGPAMFEATKEITDRYLCFLAPSTGGDMKFSQEKQEFKILHNQKLENDLMMWMQGKE